MVLGASASSTPEVNTRADSGPVLEAALLLWAAQSRHLSVCKRFERLLTFGSPYRLIFAFPYWV